MVRRLSGFAALCLVLAPVAFASGGGGTWLGVPVWIFLSVNLAVFLGLFFKYLVPKLTTFLDERNAAVRESLELAKRQDAEVAGLERRLAEGLAQIEHEITAITAKGEADAERERAEILASAGVETERIRTQAQAETEHRIERARTELTRHAAALAAQLAAEKLGGELDPATRAKLFQDGLADLERTSA